MSLNTTLIWWKSLTIKQKQFIVKTLRPNWTVETFQFSTNCLNQAIKHCIWQDMKDWPK